MLVQYSAHLTQRLSVTTLSSWSRQCRENVFDEVSSSSRTVTGLGMERLDPSMFCSVQYAYHAAGRDTSGIAEALTRLARSHTD
jgi:hypothetical protein